MINLNNITGKDAEDILKLYEGKNPYIRFMKKKFLTEKKYFLTKNQVKLNLKYYGYLNLN